ncbi:hypothetical protein HU200_048524 [Digitaria exilis]|uniref:Peptidyl-prolyl cis-trans isomerase n=1 Tax=Digitaria exilis TaxID=1010633 RepID=A0A835B668_9POAL|nr:hypothetical protein HU200_048524 [Digitaria exilis]
MAPPSNPKVYFKVSVNGVPGRFIVMELFADVAPLATENFRELCTGEKGLGVAGKPLHFLGSTFHSIIPGYMWQGGDIINGDGTGGESIYGNPFPDENLNRSHDEAGLLSMANGSANSNGSQFFIATVPAPWLDGNHVVFGKVISGLDNLVDIENTVGSRSGTPKAEVKITHCGMVERRDSRGKKL